MFVVFIFMYSVYRIEQNGYPARASHSFYYLALCDKSLVTFDLDHQNIPFLNFMLHFLHILLFRYWHSSIQDIYNEIKRICRVNIFMHNYIRSCFIVQTHCYFMKIV